MRIRVLRYLFFIWEDPYLTTDVDEEMQARAREYLTSPFSRYLVENAIAAHLLVHTECLLEPRIALERAIAIYEYFIQCPERIGVSLPTGKYARMKHIVEVSLPTSDSVHVIRLNLGLVPSEIEELPIRLTYGTKANRRRAWSAIQDVRTILLREDARRLREQTSTQKA